MPEFSKWCIPVSLHGDGTPAMGGGKSWSKMIDIWSWSSLLVATKNQLSMFLISAVHQVLKSFEDGFHTLDVAFRKMVWSFEACAEGVWPSEDWDGNALACPKASQYTHTFLKSLKVILP